MRFGLGIRPVYDVWGVYSMQCLCVGRLPAYPAVVAAMVPSNSLTPPIWTSLPSQLSSASSSHHLLTNPTNGVTHSLLTGT